MAQICILEVGDEHEAVVQDRAPGCRWLESEKLDLSDSIRLLGLK